MAFTATEDAYIRSHYATATLTTIATALGRDRTDVQYYTTRLVRQGVLHPRDRYYQPRWTLEELDYLRAHWGLLPDTVVAATLGRSVAGCIIKAKRLKRNRKANFLTAYEVARIFQVDSKTVARWIAKGWLPATKSAVRVGRTLCWQIAVGDLATFIPTHLDKFEYRRIAREPYRYWYNLVRRAVAAHPEQAVVRPARMHRRWTPADDAFLRAHWGRLPDARVVAALERPLGGCQRRAARLAITRTDLFLTLPAAARALGVPASAVQRWIASGLLPARKSTVGGDRPYWSITPTAVQTFRQDQATLIAATCRRDVRPQAG